MNAMSTASTAAMLRPFFFYLHSIQRNPIEGREKILNDVAKREISQTES